ncbi:hypothetical protein, conserved [Eimeria brunetti]|uniref:Uncharacterized protein n=1 Tax=Eimeria brunetti TaxID=51314 RepID=U6LU27_9EIME|nr:hypothetical protein, conserved [Eimeria brunetti]
MQAKAEAAEPPAGPTLYQGVIENKKGGDLTVALSSLRSSPSTERSTSSSSGSSSKYQNGRFESQKWDYPQLSSLLESSEVREKLLQRDRPETHESLQRAGDLPPIRVPRNSGSSNSSSSRGGSDGCIYIGGFAEGRSRRADFRLQAHASTPLSLIYLRPCEAPHLAEEVERKLRAFIGISCTIRQIVGSRQSCLSTTPATKEAAARGAKGCGTQHVLNLQQQTHQQQQQQQQRFAECLPQELRQQQEVEKAIRRVLFAVVEMATARQFHLPPPNVSRQLYGYDVVLSGRQAPHLGGWALQLPQAVRLL